MSKFIAKVTKRLKYILNPEAANLIEAGFINTCDGTITEAGRSALWLIVMTKFSTEFQAAALEAIAEAEEAAKNGK